MREELGIEAASYWLALASEERDETLLLAPTHTIRRQANEAVRVGLEREGILHGRTLEIDRLVDRRLTRMAGFGVRVRPSGYKSYVYHDNRTGRSTRYTLGPTGLMSVEGARRKCHEVVTEAGPDGIRENTDEERVSLFRDFVAGEWKTARYDRYKPSTRPPTTSALNGQLLPVFGALALDRITRTDVTRWFDEYSQSSPGGANWTLALLQRIMNHALACGHVRANPARGIKKNPRPKMTRFLSREEIRRLHEVLDRCVAQRPSRRQQADIIRLLLLTGCRRGEIVNLQWKEVKADVLNLADAKTGPRRVYPASKAWS